MSLDLRPSVHKVRNDAVTVIEVVIDGKVCAVIYPDPAANGIKIVSAHIMGDLALGKNFPEGVSMDNGHGSNPPIPVVKISFDPQPYTTEAGKLQRGKIVHALWEGFPLCGFNNKMPRDWPEGHIWASPDSPHVNCTQCKEKVAD